MLRVSCLVCRTWCAISQHLLYSHPWPRSHKTLRLLYKTLQQNPALAEFIKSPSPPTPKSLLWSRMMSARRARSLLYIYLDYPVEVSPDGHYAILWLFRAVAMRCPTLSLFPMSYPAILAHAAFIQIFAQTNGGLQDSLRSHSHLSFSHFGTRNGDL